MKYLVLLCDGMADTPSEMLAGATPMETGEKGEYGGAGGVGGRWGWFGPSPGG